MWDHLPPDLIADIFSFLPHDSLARAACTCKPWLSSAALLSTSHRRLAGEGKHPQWLLAMPVRSHHSSTAACHAFDPFSARWYSLSLDFVHHPLRLVAPAAAAGQILCKLAGGDSPFLRLALGNPFTRQFSALPDLLIPRTNPAVAVIPSDASSSSDDFTVYVAGGSSPAGYEPSYEVFDSKTNKWKFGGRMPAEFAVRLTVWTPNESVHANGEIFWMTSARAYSVVGLKISTGKWREVRAPMAEKLDWAALVRRRGDLLGLVGGQGILWELGEGDEWKMVGVVPAELAVKFSWKTGGTKCVGSEEAVYLFREVGKEMIVGREVEVNGGDVKQRTWEWCLINGGHCCSSANVQIKGVLIRPKLTFPCSSP